MTAGCLIPFSDLVPMDIFVGREPVVIDLAYADATHPENVFDADIYHPQARLWAHRDMAAITLLVARRLRQENGWTLQLKDCLRTVEAQAAMADTALVRANPQWQQGERRLLAPPGRGAHPRGMAIDVCVLGEGGAQLDFGTAFDYFTSDIDDNPAARHYQGHPAEVNIRRKKLEDAFVGAAQCLGLPMLPYSEEWWDFRFPADYYNRFAPLCDADLPPQMRMHSRQGAGGIADFPSSHFEELACKLIALLDKQDGNF